jgi:hypothetical protein
MKPAILKTGIATAAVVTATLLAGSASAEIRCFEGRTASGECVNAGLAQVMRHTGIVRVQPKITLNAPLNLPSEDSFYPATRDHHDERVLLGFPIRPGFASVRP